MLRPMSTRRRARSRELLLVAGHVDDLTAIQHTLALLSVDSYGQVFIEATTTDQIVPIDAPSRMTVTWLVAASECGEALGAAVAGWAAEWLPESESLEGTSTVWIGATASVSIGFSHGLQDLASEVHILPELSRLEPGTSRS